MFLTTACDCGLSSSDSTDLRIVWFSRLRCRCHRGVSATSCSTPSSSPLFRCVSLLGVSRPSLWSECFQVFSPRSWVGVPILTVRSLQACVTGVGCVFCQRQGTVGRPAMSSPVPVPSTRSHSRCLLRPRHCGGASPRGWRLEVSSPPLFGLGTLPLAGVFFHPPGSTFSSGLLPYPRCRSVSPLLLPRSAWSLALTVFLSFRELRPVQHYFFASSPSRCCPISFSAVTDAHGQCQRAQTRFSILGAVSRLMWLSSHAVNSFYIPSSRHLSRISVGSGISPGASPAFYQNCLLPLRYCGAVFAGAPSFLTRSLCGAMVHFSSRVPLHWLLCLSSYLRLGS